MGTSVLTKKKRSLAMKYVTILAVLMAVAVSANIITDLKRLQASDARLTDTDRRLLSAMITAAEDCRLGDLVTSAGREVVLALLTHVPNNAGRVVYADMLTYMEAERSGRCAAQ